MVIYCGIIQYDSGYADIGTQYFDLQADSRTELVDKMLKERAIMPVLVKIWKLRSDPRGYLEDYDKATKYMARLNFREISPDEVPDTL